MSYRIEFVQEADRHRVEELQLEIRRLARRFGAAVTRVQIDKTDEG